MRPLASLRFLRAVLATGWREATANRAAFLMQVVFMLGNDLIWFSVWWIFYARFESIGGWRLSDMMALQATLAGGYGLAVLLAGGTLHLARTIEEGGLDAWLAQPKPVLVQAAASRVVVSGLGDLAFAVLLLGLSGHLSPSAWILDLVALACATAVLFSVAVLAHSLAFWAGSMNALARQVWETLVAFSSYPDVLFSGALRMALFVVVPAGFVAWLPSGLLRDFTWGGLAAALGGAAAFVAAAVLVFGRGLSRYQSGSRMGGHA